MGNDLTIGEVSKHLGVPSKTIRFYVRQAGVAAPLLLPALNPAIASTRRSTFGGYGLPNERASWGCRCRK